MSVTAIIIAFVAVSVVVIALVALALDHDTEINWVGFSETPRPFIESCATFDRFWLFVGPFCVNWRF